MQAESVKYFTDRLDALQRSWNCSDVDLCKRIGFSRQLLYLMRGGEQKPSRKTVRLVEIAEAEASLATPITRTGRNLPYADQSASRPGVVRETAAAAGSDKAKLKKLLDQMEALMREARALLGEK